MGWQVIRAWTGGASGLQNFTLSHRDPSLLDPLRAEVYPWKQESLEKKIMQQPQVHSENPHFVFLGSQSGGVGGDAEKRPWERPLSPPQIKVEFRALVRATHNNHSWILFVLLVVLLQPTATHRSFGGCSELWNPPWVSVRSWETLEGDFGAAEDDFALLAAPEVHHHIPELEVCPCVRVAYFFSLWTNQE